MVNVARIVAVTGAIVCTAAAQDHFRAFEDSPEPEVSDTIDVAYSTVLDTRLQNVFVPGTTQFPTAVHADNLRREAAGNGDEYMYVVSSENYTAILGAAAGLGCVVGVVAYARKIGKRAADQIYSPRRVARRNTWPMSPARLV